MIEISRFSLNLKAVEKGIIYFNIIERMKPKVKDEALTENSFS